MSVTHYRLTDRDSACGLHKPRRATKLVQSVTCPSCQAWITKNLAIREKQIAKRRGGSDAH